MRCGRLSIGRCGWSGDDLPRSGFVRGCTHRSFRRLHFVVVVGYEVSLTWVHHGSGRLRCHCSTFSS